MEDVMQFEIQNAWGSSEFPEGEDCESFVLDIADLLTLTILVCKCIRNRPLLGRC